MTGKQKIQKLFVLAKQYDVVIDKLADDEWNDLDVVAFNAYLTDNWQAVENCLRRLSNATV